MSKSMVFISHITAEAEIAVAFKKVIQSAFLGLIDVFVSSDGVSIQLGSNWLDEISDRLRECAIEVIIASPQSVTRSWINFEAGAGWVRGIPVIPLCHSGMVPSKLPIPLSMLQAARATSSSELTRLFPVFAAAIKSNVPDVDLSEFIETVSLFERRYTFWDRCNQFFQKIQQLCPPLIGHLQRAAISSISVRTMLTERAVQEIEGYGEFLESNHVLRLRLRLSSAYGPNGVEYLCEFEPLEAFTKTISDSAFIVLGENQVNGKHSS